MHSKAPSLRGSAFDASTIARYTVLKVPITFPGSGDSEEKLVVVAFHESGACVCMKATSNVGLYLNNSELMAGCVFYRAGECCFHKDTVIQPDNLFAVPYSKITAPDCVIGTLPADFHGRLLKAAQASVRLPENRRRKLLAELNSHSN